jgi:anti-sigma factor RsiW
MNSPDHTLYSDLLNQELDGSLTYEQQARLDEHLAGCAECNAERVELAALSGLLRRSQPPLQEDFRARVMAALPAAGWESRHPRTWRFPAAVLLLLVGAGIALLCAGSARVGQLGSFYGVLSSLAGLLRATLVAGIGFTAASWRWCGLFVEQLVASPASMVVFGVFVVCLNLLLVSLVRRRHAAHPAPSPRAGVRAPR